MIIPSICIILFCLTNLVEWPRGTYAIPMPLSGCPVSREFSWSEGLLRQDTEDSRPLNNWSNSFHLKGEKGDSKISQHFCVKTNKTGKTQWPVGKYCIYKKGKCPFGKDLKEISAIATRVYNESL